MPEESLDEKRNRITSAFAALYCPSTDAPSACYPVEVFAAHLIAAEGDAYYRVAFAEADNAVTFVPRAEWVKVEPQREWVEALKALKEVDEYNANPLKTISATDDELRVGNYIVLFGGRDLEGFRVGAKRPLFLNPDGTQGNFFTKNTKFESGYTAIGRLPVDWEHGGEPAEIEPDEVLGYVDWKTARSDEKGVFVERVLNRHNRYVKWLEELITAGIVGTSSEAIDGKARAKATGEITHWPLYRDTLTVQPAEPRMLGENVVAALKALGVDPTRGLPGQAASDDAPALTVSDPSVNTESENPMPDTPSPEVVELTNSVKALTTKMGELETQMKAQPILLPGTTIVPVPADDKPFNSLGEQLQAIKRAAIKPNEIDPRLLEINERHAKAVKATGASEGTGADGGFAIQQEFTNEMTARMYNTGEILKRVRRREIGAGANGLVVNTIDETSRADGSRSGGVQAYWLNEGGTKTASRPKYRRFALNLEKLAALYYATDELLQDDVALQGEVGDAFSNEILFKAEDAVYNGDGVGKPLGWMNAAATISVSKETGQAAATVTHANLLSMWSRMWAASRKNAVWYYNQLLEPQLWGLYLPVGTGGIESRFVDIAPDGSLTLFGRPAIPVEYAAAPGTVGDIALVDPNEYRFISKGGVQTASSIHVQFVTDETAFRWVFRCNGAPFWNSALTPFKGSSTLSPFVTLATRA